MYSVIVVDDEKIIRKGMKNYITNHVDNYEVIGEFSDGRDALDFLRENDADVVITDIRMIDVDGLELSKWINCNKPYIVVVILSGHRDFDYARQAIEYRVDNYELKPLSPSRLVALLKELEVKIEKAREANKKEEPVGEEKDVLAEAKRYIEENFSKDISLQEVSEKLYFSPGYFSRLFKKETGENFSDYLLRVRMTKALELLKQNKKVDEVSRRCGYNSSAYFSHTFKEYYGYSPKDYIRKF